MPRRVEYQYWDTSVFIAWLSNREQNLTADEIEGVRALVRMAMAGQSRIITSALTYTEILDGYMDQGPAETFEKFLKRRNVTVMANHLGVAKKAREIRNLYLEKKNAGQSVKVLKTPDATHLATAIIAEADVLYTLDRSDFLPFDGDVAGHKLSIKVPPVPPQQTLDFSQP